MHRTTGRRCRLAAGSWQASSRMGLDAAGWLAWLVAGLGRPRRDGAGHAGSGDTGHSARRLQAAAGSQAAKSPMSTKLLTPLADSQAFNIQDPPAWPLHPPPADAQARPTANGGQFSLPCKGVLLFLLSTPVLPSLLRLRCLLMHALPPSPGLPVPHLRHPEIASLLGAARPHGRTCLNLARCMQLWLSG